MDIMKIGIIKERIAPPDRRVVFTPEKLVLLTQKYPSISVKIEKSEVRFYLDHEYEQLGFEVTDDLTDCDILFGVKEIPVEYLIPNKKYFFFSHTIKKQPHNQPLLQAVIDKRIDLYDYETVTDAHGKRLIGFGRYAGLVGAYNAFRLFGLKYELFKLSKAENMHDKDVMIQRLKSQFLPPIKIVVTGKGRVGSGVKELLKSVKIKEVSIPDFLTKKYDCPVFVQIESTDYFKRTDGSIAEKSDLYKNWNAYTSDFDKFSKVADILITGHFHPHDAPAILTREMLLDAKCSLKVVADISCDADGSIACTLRPSTIAEPFYGYHPKENKEVEVFHPSSVGVMAVNNLPCEISKDASEGFSDMLMEHVIPAFFNGDQDGVLERAQITKNGALMPRFKYLNDYVTAEGK